MHRPLTKFRVSLDQNARVISFKPSGDVARGWPCWLFFWAEELRVGEDVTIESWPRNCRCSPMNSSIVEDRGFVSP